MGNFITKRKGRNHQAPLLQPALEGDLDQIKILIGHFLATSSSSDEATNTTCGSVTSHEDKNTIHQSLAAYVNQSDQDGNTALHGAIFSGHFDISKFLIRHGHADLYLTNSMGCSPFWIACGYGRVDILEYILTSTTTATTKNKTNNVSRFDLSRACRQTNSTGDTPLMAAVFKGHFEVVEMLLSALVESSSSPTVISNDAWDVLTMANRNGDTCLGLAVSMATVGRCSNSSSSDDDDDNGNDNSSRLIHLLLDWEERLAPEEYCTDHADRPLHRKNALGLTPLLVACERDNLNIVKLLLSKAGTNIINTMDKDGRSPLAIASFCGCLDVLDYLLGIDHVDASSLVNRKDSNGCTPIWLAARTGNVQVVRKLIHAGADATIPNNAGLSAMDVAEKFQKQQVLDFFQQELPCIVTERNTVQ